MGLPKININTNNGSLGGITPSEDGVMGLITTGVAVSSKLSLNKSYTLFGLSDAEKLGITEAYDSTNSLSVYHQVKSFYDQAGEGAELWLYLVSKTVSLEQMLDKSKTHAKALLDKAEGRIKVLAVSRTPDAGYTPTVSSGLDADVIKAVDKADTLAKEQSGVSESGSGTPTGMYRPIRIVIEGRAYQGDSTNLPDLKARTNNRVSVLLASDKPSVGAVGLLLGRISKIPVQRNIGRVKDGDVGISAAYLTDGIAIEDKSIAELNSLHDKGYILLRKYDGKSGYYFSDDPTATSNSDDYNTLSKGRTIDKVIRLVYKTYVNELLDEVVFEPNGTINPAMVKYLEGQIENVINLQMLSRSELSSFRANIDPVQKVLSTGNLAVSLQVLPVGSIKSISVDLGFVTQIKN